MVYGSDSAEIVGLVAQAQQGDEQAAERLLQLYRPLVQHVARRFYLPDGEPEDVYQIGMIGLWQAIQRYNPQRQASFATFARLCIRRQILSALKHASRIVWITFPPCPDPDEESHWENIADPVPSALERLIEREQSQECNALLFSRLSAMESQVLTLWLQRLSYQEIANRLGCSRKAVDNALARIKRKARRVL